jgi:hypothetical protein
MGMLHMRPDSAVWAWCTGVIVGGMAVIADLAGQAMMARWLPAGTVIYLLPGMHT